MDLKRVTWLVAIVAAIGFSVQRPGATFLLIPPTARASGMAYAFTAFADDASANYYNAAGLAFLKTPSITATYFHYLPGLDPDMHYLYFGSAYPLGRQSWGFDVIYFTPGTTQLIDPYGNNLGQYIVWRIAPKISYARKLTERLSCSIGWKFIYLKYGLDIWIDTWGNSSLYDGSGSSWAVDLNVLYRVFKNLSLGAVLHNLGPWIAPPENWYWGWWPQESSPLPLISRLGIAYKPITGEQLDLTVSADITDEVVNFFAYIDTSFYEELKHEIKMMNTGIGIEIVLYRLLSFRLGYLDALEGSDERGITFGAGIRFKGLAFDFGSDEKIFDFHTRNRKFSLSYNF